eukprot:TRINITY_DN61608_c0_g1_i1.p1 TRINITY_DN61608_c0_g1~~TRINITY_DN61608_c0_g1_i1.p1  ORF type:complete len:176 (-),score=22.28 TRINITY_DN61608_c0_g1_i1:166-693(-)
MQSRAGRTGRTILVSGLFLAVGVMVLAVIHFWYAGAIPSTCTVDLKSYFMGAGMGHILFGIAIAFSSNAAKEVYLSSSRAAIAKYYEHQGFHDRAKEEDATCRRDLAKADRTLSHAFLIVFVALLLTVGSLFYGIVQVMSKRHYGCENAVNMFFLSVVVTLSLQVGAGMKVYFLS